MDEIKKAEEALARAENELTAAVAAQFPRGTMVKIKVGKGEAKMEVLTNSGAVLELVKPGKGGPGIGRHYRHVVVEA